MLNPMNEQFLKSKRQFFFSQTNFI